MTAHTLKMANIEIEKKYYDIAHMPQWKELKKVMKTQLDDMCDVDKIESFEELCGAKICKAWYNELIRKIDGSIEIVESQ